MGGVVSFRNDYRGRRRSDPAKIYNDSEDSVITTSLTDTTGNSTKQIISLQDITPLLRVYQHKHGQVLVLLSHTIGEVEVVDDPDDWY